MVTIDRFHCIYRERDYFSVKCRSKEEEQEPHYLVILIESCHTLLLLHYSPLHNQKILTKPSTTTTSPHTQEIAQREDPLTPVERTGGITVTNTANPESKKTEKKKSVHFSEDSKTTILDQSSKINTFSNNKIEHYEDRNRLREQLPYTEEAVDDGGRKQMKCLGEEEEIDVKVDKNSFQPRYSWISPAKVY